MNSSGQLFFDELITQVSLIEKSRNEKKCVKLVAPEKDNKACKVCVQCDRDSGITDMASAEIPDKPDDLCWLCWKNNRIDGLLRENKSMYNELSGSEAVYGFCAWLTTQDKPTVMSAYHDSGVIAGLVKTFCETNKLTEPDDRWTDKLTHPPNLQTTRTTPRTTTLEQQQTLLGKIEKNRIMAKYTLSCLSGDLNHDNVAKAKKLLIELIKEEEQCQ